MTRRWKLFPKYAVLIIALVTSTLLASGAVSLWFSYRDNQDHTIALQQEKAIAAADRIERYVQDIEHQISWTALLRVDTVDGHSPLAARRIEYLKLLRQTPAITEVAFIDANGLEQLRVSRVAMDASGSGIDRSSEPGVREAAAGGKPYFGSVYFRKGTEPYMTIVRAAGNGGGVTLSEVNLTFVWDVVSRIHIGQRGLAYVVDSNGTLIAHPDISLVLKHTDMRTLARPAVLAASAPISTLDWSVVVETPRVEAFAPLYATLQRMGLVLVLALLVSIIATFFLARTLVRPLRELQAGAARIGGGDLSRRIEVNTGDELEGLAEQFNQMSSALKDSYGGLERQVEVRTSELRVALERQTAISEILRVIASSPSDIEPMLDAVAQRARMLCDASRCSIYLREGDLMRLAATTDPAVIDADEHPALSLNLLRENQPIGSIALWRTNPQPFTESQLALLKTFADQAAIAIQNAQLFHEIQAKSTELQIANQHKSEFLANMSHELRTPLNAIIGFSEVLVERLFGELNDKQLDYLQDIHSSGKHLLSLINDILDLSKIEAGRMDLDRRSFDAASAIGNALTLVRERAQRAGIALKTDIDEKLGAIDADERMFKQILTNLLSNAVKFTPTGGEIVVRAMALDNGIQVAVEDSGIGISEADQKIVFEEFRQVGHHYTNKREGTGLGLALTRRFVELHGGSLTLASEPGRGSTFTFTIPGQTCTPS